MSLAACEERCARLRTSEATTAKPRPASPARAASTAALSASRLVCRAISSITPMMSEILREDSSIARHRARPPCATTSPPRSATSRVPLVELIGLLGVLGVLLHGRGDLLHRGRGLLQARGLLLGALRQIGRAGRDLGRGVGDFARRRLDLGDGRADSRSRRRVGVVLQRREIALIVGVDARVRSPSASAPSMPARCRSTPCRRCRTSS